MSFGFGVALHELRHLPAVWRAIGRSRADIERRALRGVNDLLRFARARVPYYADPAYDRPPLRSLDELAQLPLLDKPTVLAAGEQRFHDPALPPRRYRVDRTSGSSGMVLEVRHDISGYGYHGATLVRRFLTSGYRPWWRIAQIKGFARPVRWFQRLRIFPRVVVPAGLPEPELKDRVLAVRPQLIMGYPVMLRALLRQLSAAEREALRRSLRLVMTDSELLTEPVADQLEAGFGVPVLDEYSAFEVLTVASQCRHGSMHIDEDRVWLELVDEAGRPVPDGVTGSVVITHFRERAMPLVRYQLGDRAQLVPGACGCGRAYRRIRLVDGRVNDYLVLPDGRRVYSAAVLAFAPLTVGVADSTMRQDAQGRITVHLVPDPRTERTFEELADEFAKRFATDIDSTVELQFVRADRIELGPGGKGRVVESHYRPGPD